MSKFMSQAESTAVATPTGTRRGRMTVFVAAAPGAGKTFAMLEEGRRLRAEGRDVVVGIVETYNRPKTIAEVGDLEVVPRRVIHYKGLELEEMDLDAILARHPEWVLIDEIYHTNAPGTRNERRYEDIAEIREAGVNVMTTMNIQHLESLKDVAEQISGMTIRETIPDRLLEDADEIQLVDISPEALRKRMQHGNIYPLQNVERALHGYFRPGNLAALRELALNWLANTESERLGADEELPRENVLAAVREPLASQALVRRGVRMSRRYGGDCTIVTVLKPGEALSEELEQTQKLARALVEEVRTHHATQLVVGAPGGGFLERYRATLVDDLLDELRDVDLHVIARYEPTAPVEGAINAAVVEAEAEPAAEPV
ncbi:MAG TPA: hypothetical protein VG245_02635, partial [Candidatus Dormibacteraeota bacterium]|nr:hypothetical protein [Candidatus Dormibacteraeota bacterium]